MSGVGLLAVLVLDAIIAAAVGAWFGLRAHREQTRIRGERLRDTLDAIARSGTWGDDRLPRVPVLRGVAKLADLPDPYPPSHPTNERPTR